LLRLSAGEAMRNVLQNQPLCDLSMKMKSHLYRGLTVPDELAVQALEVCMLDMKCQTRGCVCVSVCLSVCNIFTLCSFVRVLGRLLVFVIRKISKDDVT